uniref:choice-of-anchor C family protein n=1 Tax=Cyanothece sp. BG0011 TaxID=2082950 RepID=UPI0018E57B2A
MKQNVFRSLQVILMAVALMLMMVGQPAMAQTHPSHNSFLNDYTVAVGTATAKAQKSNYAPNEQIIVEYSGFPGNARDWITITPATRPDNSYGQYFYTQGKQNGTYTFNGLPAGDYQVRGYFNWSAGGYNVQTRSNFTVGGTAVIPPTTEPDVCLEGVQATLIDFNTAEPLNGAVNPISSGGVTVSFEGLKVLEVGTSQGGFGGQAGPNQVIASDQANFNGRFLTEPGGRGAYRPTNYRRAITFSEPVNHLCLYMADVDSGQGINVKVSNAKGESLYSKAFPSSTGAEAALTKLDLSQLEGIKTIEMIGDDPIGIDNLIFASIETKPEPTPEPTTPDCSQDNLIKNGSFELGQEFTSNFIRLPVGSTKITNWVVTGADVDYLRDREATDGRKSIDLDGNIGSAGGVEQTFSTVPGQTYQVSFDLAGNTGSGPTIKKLKVSAAGESKDFTFDITGKSFSNMGYEGKTWTFTAKEPTTTLTFLSQDDSGWGPVIDNVAVVSNCDQITPEPNPCDPNQPIPGAFSTIRIGDFDGFGFGDGKGLKSASSDEINVDGVGILSTQDFLPDLNGDGKFSNRDGGDPFDNRSEAEVTGTSLTGDGYEDTGSTGSDYTDVFLGKAFAYQGSPTYGHSFPDGDPTTLPNTPGFKFRFKVAKEKLPQGTPLFLNVVLGDFDVEPVRVIL